MQQPRPRRIFMASPTDLSVERDRAKDVVEKLIAEAQARDPFELFRWEDQPDKVWDAGEGWQAQTGRPSEDHCEIVICAFGERIGSPLPATNPLPDDFDLPDGIEPPGADEETVHREGGIPLTGSLFEFFDAIQGQKRNQSPKHIHLFLKGDSTVEARGAPSHERNWGCGAHYAGLPRTHHNLPRAVADEYYRQTDFLGRFFDEFLGNQSAWTLFTHPDDFAAKLEVVLRQDLGLGLPEWQRGNPFKRLERYEVDESVIFCGRDDDVQTLVRRLKAAEDRQDRAPCLVLKGASGRGKSSLLRAGLGAALQDGRFRGTTGADFRSSVVSVSELEAPEPLGVLLETLRESALPKLAEDAPQQVAEAPPDYRVAFAAREVKRALEGAEDDRDRRLFVAVDQFEEVIGPAEPCLDRRWQRVVQLLLTLAEEGLAYTALGLKPDWWPPLSAWLEQSGTGDPNVLVHFDLGAPRWERILVEPFRACDLEVEDTLRDHIVTQAEELQSLPLLSVGLHRIYERYEERRREWERKPFNPLVGREPFSQRLDLEHYRKEANLRAAIDHLGEQAFTEASRGSEDTVVEAILGRILRQLVWIPASSSQQTEIKSRGCPASALPERAGSLLDALEQYRILLKRNGNYRLMHDAVMEDWSRARSWLAEERQHLQTREGLKSWSQWIEDPTEVPLPPKLIDRAEAMMVAWRDEEQDPLISACIREGIRSAARNGNLVREDGVPRILDAARMRDEELVRTLLDAGANPNARTPATTEADGSEGGQSTSLMFAAWDGSEALTRLLVERGADPHLTNRAGFNALFYAALHGHTSIVRYLHSEHQVDLTGGSGPWSAVRAAAGGGFVDTLRYLLDHGVDPGSVDASGWTALEAASHAGHRDVVEVLLDRDAPVEPGDLTSPGALGLAADEGQAEVIRLLLERGARTDRRIGKRKATALHLAASAGHVEAVRALAESALDPGAATERGTTALHAAAEAGHAAVCEALIDAGAPLRVWTEARQSPLSVALERDRPAVARVLVDAGYPLPPWYTLAARHGPPRLSRLHGPALRRALDDVWQETEAEAAGPGPALLAPDGAWVERDEAMEILLQAAESAPEALGCGVSGILGVHRGRVPYYPDADLVEVRVLRSGSGTGCLTFLFDGEEVTWLDGTAPPIHYFNGKGNLQIGSDAAALAYLLLFTSAVTGGEGAFTIVRGADELRWSRDVEPWVEREAAAALIELQVTQQEPGLWGAQAAVHYGSGLFVADLRIPASGQVSMSEDQQQAEDLPLLLDTFIDGVRVVEPARTEGEPKFLALGTLVVEEDDEDEQKSEVPTYAMVATQLLRDSASFFDTVGESNESLKDQMAENAQVFRGVAGLLASDPAGSIEDEPGKGQPHASLAARLLRDAAGFLRTVADNNPDSADQLRQNADVCEEVAGYVEETPTAPVA